MKFETLARFTFLAFACSAIIGVSMAAAGFGYWALVGMNVSNVAIYTIAIWMAMPWLPGRPTHGSGVRSMLRVGRTVTLNQILDYFRNNAEKLLLGSFWGPETLGLYTRAFQLANLPVQQLNLSVGNVTFPALSRLQGDVERLNRSFLKSYAIVVSLTVPIPVVCLPFSEEIVHTLLGPKWMGAAPVLSLLAPGALAFSLTRPFGPFLQATGRSSRSLRIAFLTSAVVILGIAVGVRYGTTAVALGYTLAMALLVVPAVAWAKHGTGITTRDYWNSIKRPLIAGAIAALAGWVFRFIFHIAVTPVPLCFLGLSISLGLYSWLLLIVMGEKSLYADLFNQVYQRLPAKH